MAKPEYLDLARPSRQIDANYIEQGGKIFAWDDAELANVRAWWLDERPPGLLADRIMREIGTYHRES